MCWDGSVRCGNRLLVLEIVLEVKLIKFVDGLDMGSKMRE